jgi:hypothetical protein
MLLMIEALDAGQPRGLVEQPRASIFATRNHYNTVAGLKLRSLGHFRRVGY